MVCTKTLFVLQVQLSLLHSAAAMVRMLQMLQMVLIVQSSQEPPNSQVPLDLHKHLRVELHMDFVGVNWAQLLLAQLLLQYAVSTKCIAANIGC